MKKHVHETWYLLADGTHADPNDVSKGKDGVMRHKNGIPVALRDSGLPYTVGHGLRTNKNVEAAEVGESELAPPDVDVNKPAAEVGKTEIDPATGAANDDVAAEEPAADDRDDAPAKAAKSRELKAGKAKGYKTR